jgi:hypothetical protein
MKLFVQCSDNGLSQATSVVYIYIAVAAVTRLPELVQCHCLFAFSALCSSQQGTSKSMCIRTHSSCLQEPNELDAP